MESIGNFLKKVPRRTYTPEQIKAAQEHLAEQRAAEMGCFPTCPHYSGCPQNGYVRVGDGTIRRCPHIDLRGLAYSERFGLTAREFKTLTWESLKRTKGTEQAIEAIQALLARVGGWVYLYGDYGTGKTRLLKTAIADALANGKEAVYATLPDILDQLAAAFEDRNPDMFGSRLDYWANLPILAIDEIDKLRDTSYRQEREFLLLDRRYVQGCEATSITLLASNCNPAELHPYLSDRIRDRRFKIVELRGASFRTVA